MITSENLPYLRVSDSLLNINVPSASYSFSMEELLAPLSTRAFIQDYWGQRCYLQKRGDPSFFSPLFSMEDLDSVLSLTGQGLNHSLRVVKSESGKVTNRELSSGPQPNMFELYLAYGDGFTLIVNAVDQRWQPISAMCQGLQNTMDHQVGANLYVTPPNSQGFLPHFDDHDVFILQIEGSKTWRLYPNQNPLPLANMPEPTASELGEAEAEFVLDAGDLLYIPRGHVHEAATSKTGSIHLTVGINVFTWLDLLTEILKRQAEGNIDLRVALPPGFLHSDGAELTEVAEKLLSAAAAADTPLEVLDHFRSILRRASQPAPDGHFSSLNMLSEVAPHTLLRRRPNFVPIVRKSGDVASIEFGGNSVSGPVGVWPALRYIASNETFQISDLPDSMTANAKIVLSCRLVKAGLLSIIKEKEE